MQKAEYKVHVSKLINDTRWDDFVECTPGGHHVQTSLWSEVKALLGWKAIRILVKETNQIVGGSQLLIKSYPLIGSVVYVSKGPLLAYNGVNLADLLLKEIILISRTYHVQFLAVQPPNNDQLITARLPSFGFSPSLLELAPTASILLDLSPPIDIILASMKRQTRQNIKRSKREGITTRQGSKKDLHNFYCLHQVTSQRQNFIPYPEEYFALMWNTFAKRGKIALIMAEFKGEPVSAMLLIPFGDTVIAKILGWSGMHSKRRPNDAVFFASIEWSKSSGYRWFDFEGITIETAKRVLSGNELLESMKRSPDFIKLGYGGQVVLYPITFEKLPNPLLYWAYKRWSPRIGDSSPISQLIERLRKR